MIPFRGGVPHCKRCGSELEGNEESCPHCGFHPRQMGLRVSLSLLMIVVVSMTIVMMTMSFFETLSPYLVGLAAIAFALAVVTFVISFIATPYRLGSIFNRL